MNTNICPGTDRQGAGYTLVELVITATLLVTLAAVALPTGKYTIRRGKEIALHQSLRQIRNAIDEHKRYSDAGLITVDVGSDGYPSEIEILVEGVEIVGQIDKSARFFVPKMLFLTASPALLSINGTCLCAAA